MTWSREFLHPTSWLAAGLVAVIGASGWSGTASAQNYQETTLVASAPGMGAVSVDPNLIDSWGIARSTSGPWWVADRATGVSTLYDSTGTILPLVVTIPHGSPTGIVFNGSTDFAVTRGNPAFFIFASLTGTISAWSFVVDPKSAVMKVPSSPGSVLTGATIAQIGDKRYLYVADLGLAKVSVYDTNFAPVVLNEEAFHDSHVPNGYAPFNVQNIGNNLYVTFAKQNATKTFVAFGQGGFVDIFTPDGKFIAQLQKTDAFDAPFGLVLAPTDFGTFSHKLLVGQFGNGEILAFNAETGEFEGQLLDQNGNVIAVPGIWGLSFGAGQIASKNSGPANDLFFAAGPNQGNAGLFGYFAPVATDLTQGGDQ